MVRVDVMAVRTLVDISSIILQSKHVVPRFMGLRTFVMYANVPILYPGLTLIARDPDVRVEPFMLLVALTILAESGDATTISAIRDEARKADRTFYVPSTFSAYM